MPGLIQVTTTIDDPQKAQELANGLIQERLAACVQVEGPITSTYRWQEQVETAKEWRILIKSSYSQWPDLERYIQDHHSYDVPELVAIEFDEVALGYQQWWLKELTVS